MSSKYDWHPTSNKGGSVFKVETRNLGWWVALAIIFSVVIHILLYVVLREWKRAARPEPAIPFRLQTKQETIDRSKLEALLKDPEMREIPDDVTPQNLSDLEMIQEIDDFDLMDMLRDEPIRMAPVESPQIFAGEVPQVPREALDMAANTLDLAAAEVLSRDLAEMRNKLVEASNQVAAEQPVLEVDASDVGESLNTDEFFKDAASKIMGEEADEFVKGYASLDDLIARTGGIRKGEELTALLPSDILFDYNEATLKEDAELAMIKLAYLIETNPDAVFIIEGHTDSFGTDSYNLDLSLRRARSVREWLVEKLRINPANIRVVGKGRAEPIVPTTGNAEEQALNRRVEIEIRS